MKVVDIGRNRRKTLKKEEEQRKPKNTASVKQRQLTSLLPLFIGTLEVDFQFLLSNPTFRL